MLSLCARFVLSKSLLLIASVFHSFDYLLLNLLKLVVDLSKFVKVCQSLSKFVKSWSLLLVRF